MVPLSVDSSAITAAIQESLPDMALELINLILSYADSVDYGRLARMQIAFDRDGRVTNPKIRDAIKDALVSSDCSTQHKTALLRTLFAPARLDRAPNGHFSQVDIAAMFREIADSGYLLVFDNTDLSGLTLMHLNWSGVSLRFANLNRVALINMEMPGADLTGATVEGGEWTSVNLADAILSDTDLQSLADQQDVNLQGALGVNYVQCEELTPNTMASLPVYSSASPSKSSIVGTVTNLPVALVDLIVAYATEVNFELLEDVDSLFDETGRFANPDVRALIKEAFMSPSCSPQIKTILMFEVYHQLNQSGHVYALRRKAEFGALFKEIVAYGDRIMFDDVNLSHMEIVGVDWTGASLRKANLSETTMIGVKMPNADLSGVMLRDGVWIKVNVEGARLTDVEMNQLATRQVAMECTLHSDHL